MDQPSFLTVRLKQASTTPTPPAGRKHSFDFRKNWLPDTLLNQKYIKLSVNMEICLLKQHLNPVMFYTLVKM